jgi:hypothetical protein
VACGQAPPAAQNAGDATKPATPASSPEPWRYLPALTAAVPPGVAAEPVLELADGLHGRARVVVAVARDGVPARLEVWDFSQRNPRERLERTGEPVLLLDLAALDGAELPRGVVDELRREAASPTSEQVRSSGLPGEPAAVLAELARLAAEARGQGPAAARARALAHFTRGLDDRLLWETARLPELLRRLSAGPWQAGASTPLGTRRVKLAAQEGERALQLELARAQERWVLTDVAP